MKTNTKTSLIEHLYGIILITNENDQIRYFQKIQSKWNENIFHQRLYDSIEELIKTKTPVDLLSVVSKFREKGWIDKNTIAQISALSPSYTTDLILYANNLFVELETQYMFRKAMEIRNKIDHCVESGNLTIEKFNEILDQGKNINVPIEKQLTNEMVINEMLNNSLNAKNGFISGIDLKYSILKEVVLLEPVDMLVIGARPGMGKTAFAISTMIRMAFSGYFVVLFSLEMSTMQIMRRIVANITGIDSNKIKYGNINDQEQQQIKNCMLMPELQNIKIFEGSHTINEISAKLNSLEKCHVFIVDYLQKVTPKRNSSRYDSVTEISNGIKLISQNMQIPSIALAQLSRDSSKVGKRPSLPDLKESGEIEQDASIVAFLHRPEYYGEEFTFNGNDSRNICEFIIGKNREGEIGIFEMVVDLKTSKFV
jgi:replicative DNA helicase